MKHRERKGEGRWKGLTKPCVFLKSYGDESEETFAFKGETEVSEHLNGGVAGLDVKKAKGKGVFTCTGERGSLLG